MVGNRFESREATRFEPTSELVVVGDDPIDNLETTARTKASRNARGAPDTGRRRVVQMEAQGGMVAKYGMRICLSFAFVLQDWAQW